ncbi:MAG: 6-phosphofructokinase [Wenzhouxiangella sp.]|nr:MAG: 6-phosphofructokinase [Wenzhouxiangella sp.]
MKARNILYAQSGGVTPVINASAAGVIEAARRHGERVGRVLAARDGIIGALTEDLVDTAQFSSQDLVALAQTPGGIFGSCRYKLKGLEDSRREYERLLEVFRAHDIGIFLYNGGNDSADTALKVSRMSREMGMSVRCIAVPKTIDNDLEGTDNSPGFGSVAKYVAVSTLEASLDVKSMASTSTKVFVLEVMGRHAGWIAAAGGLVRRRESDPPHIILFPEIPFQEQRFLDAVDDAVDRHGYCSIVVSEGLRDAEGNFLSDAGTSDAFGHRQLGGVAPTVAALVKDRLGYKYHWAVSDYLQRSARHIASQTDVDQAFAVGEAAVDLALDGHSGVLAGIVREADEPYRWSVQPVPLEQVANHEKKMPPEFISSDGYAITEPCRRYLQPLIAGQAYPDYGPDGLPAYLEKVLTSVDKKLPAFEL